MKPPEVSFIGGRDSYNKLTREATGVSFIGGGDSYNKLTREATGRSVLLVEGIAITK